MPEKSTPSEMPRDQVLPDCAGNQWDWVKQKLGMICALSGIRAVFIDAGLWTVTEASVAHMDLAVISLQNRNLQGLSALVSSLRANSKAKIFVVMNDWLQGYRRILPPEIESFYWYETYRIWLSLGPQTTHRSQTQPANSKENETPSLVFCFGNSPESRRHLCAALEELGCSCIALECNSALPAGNPGLVIWLGESELAEADCQVDFLKKLQIAYPNCIKIGIKDFPRFETSMKLFCSGLDFEIGTPYDLSAILATASLFSSAALRRR